MATGDKLVTLDGMKALKDALYTEPAIFEIAPAQWSGSSGDWYFTVSASNVTEDSILIPQYDVDSAALLNGPIWCVPDDGEFTIHTMAIPGGTVNIMVLFPGTKGVAQVQVLPDAYTTDQVDAMMATTSGKLTALNGASIPDATGNHYEKSGKVVTGFFRFISPSTVSSDLVVAQLPVGFRPKVYMLFPAITPWTPNDVFIIRINPSGDIILPSSAWTASKAYAFSFAFVTD